jgi:Putative Ig domain
MSQTISASLFDLAAVRVSKYSYDSKMQEADVRFKVQSLKTKESKFFSTRVYVTPTMIANALAGEVNEAVTSAAWEAVYTEHYGKILAFVQAETLKPSPNTAYVVASVFPPSWETLPDLGDYEANASLSILLEARLASTYAIVGGALPPGVSLNQLTAEISGTVAGAGVYTFTVEAIGSAPSLTARRIFSLRVAAPPQWVTTSLPDASTGSAVSTQLVATDAIAFAISAGDLPPGLVMSETGLISGIPTVTGTFEFTVDASLTAVGGFGSLSSSQDLSISIGTLPQWQTATALDDAPTAEPFSRSVVATSAVSYSLFSGALPPGTSLSAAGVITGTPSAAGAYVFTIKASSAAATIFATRAFSLRIETPPTWVTGTFLTAVATGTPTNVTLNATLAYSYSVVSGSLPAGLVLSSATGILSGTPTVPGDFSFTVRAYSPAPSVYTDRNFSMQIANTPVWVTSAIADGATGVSASQQLTASSAVFYSIDSGALPGGVLLSSGGLLSGSPSSPGTYSFTVRAASVAASVFATRAFTFKVEDTPAFVTTSPLLEAEVNVAQSRTFVASNTTTYSLLSGALPTGMSLSGVGAFYGTPTVVGVFSFVVKATSPSPTVFATKSFGITIAARPVWVTPAILTPGPTGVGLSYPLAATSAVSYAVASGTVPPGLTLSAQGTLSGTPTAAGSYVFTVSAVSAGPSIFTDRAFTLLIADTPVWTTAFALTAPTKDVSYSLQLDASSTTGYALQAGTLPAGLTLSVSGVLSGTATVSGSYSFTVRAQTTAFNVYVDRAFTMIVATKPVWTTIATLPGIATNEAYSRQLTATSGVTFAVQSGALPAGVDLSTAGVLSGVPTTADTNPASFTIRATSTAPNVWTDQAFTLFVVDRPVFVTPAYVPDVILGTSQSVQLTATYAVNYVVQSGAPPTGCSVSSTGLLSGTTTASAAFSFVVRARTLTPDVFSDRTFTQIVGTYPAWISGTDIDVPLNIAFSRQLAATDAATFEIVSGQLPTGLSLSSSGVISGTSTASGTFIAGVRAVSIAPALYTDRSFTLRAAFVPIWSTSPIVPDATTNVAIADLQLNASAAVTYTVVSGALPTGVTVSSAGVLSGTPTVSGVFTFSVRAATAAGSVFTDQTFTFTVSNKPVWVTVSRLGDRQKDATLSVQVTATDASTYTVVSGALPVGVTLSSTGVLSGTPTTAGDTTFTVRAGTPAPSVYTDRTFNMLVVTQPTWLTAATLSDINTGTAVSVQFQANDAATFTVVSGTLVTGTSLSTSGLLTGTASTAGAFTFTIRAYGASVDVFLDRVFTVRVGNTPSWVTLAALADRVVDVALSVQLEATDGATYQAMTALPTGLSLNTFGLLTGTPTQNGLGSFTVRAFSQAADFYSDRIFSLLVAATPVWVTTSPLTDAQKGVPLSTQLTASDTSSYSVVSGTLPPGLTLSSIGVLAGTPVTDGPYAFTVRAVSASASIFADRAFALLIETTPIWVTAGTLSDVATGEAYSVQLVATEVDAFSVRGGALPTGITMSPAGLLSGTPTASGAFSFTVRAESTSTALFVERTFDLLVATRPVWSTAELIPDAASGVAFSLQLVASSATGGYDVRAGALPAGAAFPSTGLLTVASPVAGANTFTVRAKSASAAIYSEREFTLLFVDVPVWQTPATLVVASGALGVSQQFAADFATTYTLESGVIPPGTSLSAAGLLSGAADASGVWQFTVRAEAFKPAFYALRAFTVTVEKTPVWVTAAALDPAATLVSLTTTLTATDTATYTVVSGALPTGLSIVSVTGAFAGTSLVPETTAFTVRAESANGLVYADRTFTLRTVDVPAWTTASSLVLSSGSSGLSTQLSATDAFSYALESGLLPSGTSLSSQGLLTGNPDTAGPWNFTVRATGELPAFFALRDFQTTVELPPIWATAAALDPLRVGSPELVVLNASGGDTYAVVAGSLPPGMSLGADGTLSGTPTVSGLFAFTARATTGSGYLYEDLEFTVRAVDPPVWTTPQAIFVVAGQSLQFVAAHAETYALESGTLPPGLTLSATGLLSGSLSAAGAYTFELRAVGPYAEFYALRTFSATAESGPVWVTPATLDPVQVAVAATVLLTATEGAAYSVVAGTLPTGMSLAADGTLSGTPSVAAAFQFTVRATAASGDLFADREFTQDVVLVPTWTTAASQIVLEGVPLQFVASDALTFQLESGVLPPGLTLSAAGLLSGALTAAGTFAFELRAVGDYADFYAVRAFTVTAELIPVFTTPAALDPLTVDASELIALTATGAEAFALISGSLPPGITMNSAGELSGVPTTAGVYVFEVRGETATGGLHADREFTVQVVKLPVWTTTPTLVLSSGSSGLSTQLAASDTTAYSLESGLLPSGTTLSAAGLLSGFPDVAGPWTFTVRATGALPAFFTLRTFTTFVELPPVWVTAPTLAALTVAESESVTLTATGASDFTVTKGTVPPGMTLYTDGTLSGTPTTEGAYAFTVRAALGSLFEDLEFTVQVYSVPSWTTPASLTVVLAQPLQFVAAHASAFALESGTLPPGLTLSASGLLSGTLTAGGPYTFELRASSPASGLSALRTFSADAQVTPVWSTPTALDDIVVGDPVSLQLDASGQATYALNGGDLPDGLTLSSAGVLSGTSTSVDAWSFTVRAQTSGGLFADRAFTVTTHAQPAWVTPASVVLLEGAPFSFAATGASTYSVTAGALPATLTLAADGSVSGALTTAGTFTFTINAQGTTAAATATRAFTATAELIPIWTTPSPLASIEKDDSVSIQLTATHAASYSVISGDVPTGTSLSAAGLLSGTATQAGANTFTVRASSATGQVFADTQFSLLVVSTPEWTTSPGIVLPGSTSVSLQLQAQFASTFALESGVLPSGTSLSSAGLLTGAPTVNGSFSFTVRATGTDAAFYALRTFTVTVELSPEWVTTSPLAPLERGVYSSVQLVATDGVTFDVVGGTTPDGMAVTTAGFLEGTPTTGGFSTFTVRAFSGSGSSSADLEFTVQTLVRPVWQTGTSLPAAIVSTPYSQVLTATDATGYSTSDPLPAGLTLSAAGLLSGTPTAAGSYSFTVDAADDLTASRQFNLVVS